jgi:hypothetical protein
MFQKPRVADLRQAAQKLGMHPSDAYLDAVEEIISPLGNAYATLDATPDELPGGRSWASGRAVAAAVSGSGGAVSAAILALRADTSWTSAGVLRKAST